MTDYEQFKELFDSVGQEYNLYDTPYMKIIEFVQGEDGLCVDIRFDENGKFTYIGAYSH